MRTAVKVSSEHCLVSLLFAPDKLPHPADIFSLADADRGFSIAHDLRRDGEPVQALELLASGLLFDCRWPEAALGIGMPDILGRHGLPPEFETRHLRPVRLMTNTRATGGNVALPLAQEVLGMAARFSTLPDFSAAIWHPGRSVMGQAYLRSVSANWIEGGIFPTRGLIALREMPDGAIQSEGLAFFIGQEMRIEPELLGDPDIADRIAARLVDRLIGAGRADTALDIMGSDGRKLRVAPSSNGRILRVWGG